MESEPGSWKAGSWTEQALTEETGPWERNRLEAAGRTLLGPDFPSQSL